MRSAAATVVEAFTAVVADFTVAGFGVVVRFAAEAFSVAETGSAAVERSAVESGFVAPEPSAAAFVAAGFVTVFVAAAFTVDGAGD